MKKHSSYNILCIQTISCLRNLTNVKIFNFVICILQILEPIYKCGKMIIIYLDNVNDINDICKKMFHKVFVEEKWCDKKVVLFQPKLT